MKKIDVFVARRRELAKRYNEGLSRLEGVRIPRQLEGTNSSLHLYVLSLELDKLRGGRKEIFVSLRAENIGVHVHYKPVYLHPYYQGMGYKRGLCPIAEKWYEAALTIPLFLKMTNEDVETVIEGVEKVINYFFG